TTIRVTLRDGREAIVEGIPRDRIPAPADQANIDRLAHDFHTDKAFDLSRKESSAREAVERYGYVASNMSDLPQFAGKSKTAERFVLDSVQWDDIRHISVLREDGPSRLSWWWQHAFFSVIAIVLAVLLWVSLFLIRWIAAGFFGDARGPKGGGR